MPKRYPRRSGRGIFLFFQKGDDVAIAPFCIPQRDFPARRGYAQILAGRGLVPLLFPAICPPPLPPSRCCGVPKWCPHRSGRGIFYFFKRGSGQRPPFASPRGTFLPGGAMRKFWRGGGSSRSFFPPSPLPPTPLPLLWCSEEVPPPQREGDFFVFSKGGRCGHRPPFASPRGTFLPGGAMRKFWRGGTWFFHFPCLGMQKARKPMLPGFCVTPNSRSSSSPSAGSCGRCAPPWGRCPGSTAPGRPCRR